MSLNFQTVQDKRSLCVGIVLATPTKSTSEEDIVCDENCPPDDDDDNSVISNSSFESLESLSSKKSLVAIAPPENIMSEKQVSFVVLFPETVWSG